MARDHARINLTIWGDPDFRALPVPAQHLYLLLWTHPDLSYCGSLEWRPGKMSGFTAGRRRVDVEQAADCLRARHFIVVDEETEEVLVRSWVRWDGLMKQPRMAVSCVTAYGNLGSETLRRALVHELRNLRERHPDLSCWSDDRIAQVLTHPAVSAKGLPVPSDPFDPELAPTLDPGLDPGLPQTQVGVCTPPTPTPAPAPSTTKDTAPRKRAARIDPDFVVTDDMRSWAKDKGFGHLDLDAITEEFVDYWIGVAGSKATKTDWVATWRNRVREVSKRVRPINSAASKRPTGVPEGW